MMWNDLWNGVRQDMCGVVRSSIRCLASMRLKYRVCSALHRQGGYRCGWRWSSDEKICQADAK